MNTEFWNRLMGRIIALEVLMDGMLTNVVRTTSEPGATLDGVRQAMLAGLQQIERPRGEAEDEVWGFAMEALDMRFANVRGRLTQARRG